MDIKPGYNCVILGSETRWSDVEKKGGASDRPSQCT